MNYRSSVLIFLTLLACESKEEEVSSDESMLISTLSAEEEGMIDHEQAHNDDETGPELFRVCDRGAFFDRLSTENQPVETDNTWYEDAFANVSDKKKKRGKHRAKKMLERLILIYDLDEDGLFSESEKSDIFSDFDARCEALHERILSEFDADEDGLLSEEEKLTAKETIADQKEAHKTANPCNKEKEEQPDLPLFAQEFDLDEDSVLSDEELQTLRDVLRERIRNGEAWNRPAQNSQNEDEQTEAEEESEIESENLE